MSYQGAWISLQMAVGVFTGCRGHITCGCGYLNMCSWIFSQVVLDVGTDAVCLVFNWFDTTMYKDCSHYLRKRYG